MKAAKLDLEKDPTLFPARVGKLEVSDNLSYSSELYDHCQNCLLPPFNYLRPTNIMYEHHDHYHEEFRGCYQNRMNIMTVIMKSSRRLLSESTSGSVFKSEKN